MNIFSKTHFLVSLKLFETKVSVSVKIVTLCAHWTNGFDCINLVLFLEQTLNSYLEISQGEGHNRCLKEYTCRLQLSVISEYNKRICKVVLNPAFCKDLVLHRCDIVDM